MCTFVRALGIADGRAYHVCTVQFADAGDDKMTNFVLDYSKDLFPQEIAVSYMEQTLSHPKVMVSE